MKNYIKKTILKNVAAMAFHEARKSVNQACPFFHNQPVIPESVKKLKNNER